MKSKKISILAVLIILFYCMFFAISCIHNHPSQEKNENNLELHGYEFELLNNGLYKKLSAIIDTSNRKSKVFQLFFSKNYPQYDCYFFNCETSYYKLKQIYPAGYFEINKTIVLFYSNHESIIRPVFANLYMRKYLDYLKENQDFMVNNPDTNAVNREFPEVYKIFIYRKSGDVKIVPTDYLYRYIDSLKMPIILDSELD